MKKLSLMLCMAFVILARLLPMGATAAQAAAPSESTFAAAYKAYYEILKAAVDKQGVIKKKPGSQEFDFDTGKNELVYAELIDFGNAGLPSLLYICSGGTRMSERECYIYTYSNGFARQLLHQPEGGECYYEVVPYTADGSNFVTAYMGLGGDNFHGYDIATDKNGVNYLRVFHYWWAEQDDYYTIGKSGEWIVAFWRDYAPSMLEGDEFEWYVNGDLTDKQSYENASKNIFGIVETRRILEDADKAYPETVYSVLVGLEPDS